MTGTRSCRFRTLMAAGATLLALASTGSVFAGEFALAVSPPRFELQLKAGESSRQVLEITNAVVEATPLSAKTADWSLAPDNSVTFYDELQPGSCRPWVAIERRELTVSGGKPFRFRFEVSPPADAPPGECRFAIMLEGQEQLSRAQGGPAIPFSARLGVVVYVVVGSAIPELTITGNSVQRVNGKLTPVLQVRNTGAAHGRLAGFLSGTDASGKTLEFTPSSLPILPGETRAVTLNATREGDQDTEVQVQFPVTVRGKLEWGKSQTYNLDQRFAP